MSHLSSKYLNILSGIGFLTLFPGFFFYHLGIAFGIIPPFIAGLFGPMTAILILCSSILFITIWRDQLENAKILLFLFTILVFYTSAWSSIHYAVGSARQFGIHPLTQVGIMVVAWLALFVVGSYLPTRTTKFRVVVLSSFVIICVVELLFYNTSNMMFYAREEFAIRKNVASYQGFATSILYSCLCSIALERRSSSKILLAILGITALFLSGARSEFYGFIVVMSAFFAIRCLRSSTTTVLSLLASILLVICAIGWRDEIHLPHMLFESRIVEPFKHKSTSWTARERLAETALGQISNEPFSGVYAGNFYAGGVGAYAHNILSAWVSFGFIGFGLYVALIVYTLYVSLFAGPKLRTFTPEWELAFLCCFLTFVLIVAAEPVFWPLPAFGWGLVVNATRQDRNALQT